jgi:hypothetical protein
MKEINLEQATELVMKTDYACFAVEHEGNEINTADAAAFFLEGYNYLVRKLSNCKHNFKPLKMTGDLVCEKCHKFKDEIVDYPEEMIVKIYNRLCALVSLSKRKTIDKIKILEIKALIDDYILTSKQ